MGGALVIKDIEEYVQEAEDQINIKDAYKKASTDSTQTHTRLVNDTIK